MLFVSLLQLFYSLVLKILYLVNPENRYITPYISYVWPFCLGKVEFI